MIVVRVRLDVPRQQPAVPKDGPNPMVSDSWTMRWQQTRCEAVVAHKSSHRERDRFCTSRPSTARSPTSL